MTYAQACLKLESRNRASSNTNHTTATTRTGISHAPRLNLSLTGSDLRLIRYSTTVEAYMTAGSSVAAPNNVNNAVSECEKIARISSARTTYSTVALSGVRNFDEIWFHCCQPGKRSSRDIAQVSRTPVTMMTSPQAKIARTTITSRRVATAEPSVLSMTSAIGVPDWASATGSPAASVTATMKKNPSTPEASTACHIARGTTRSGSLVSSARLAADSKPTMVKAPSRKPSIHGPAVVRSPQLQYPS